MGEGSAFVNESFGTSVKRRDQRTFGEQFFGVKSSLLKRWDYVKGWELAGLQTSPHSPPQ